MLKWGGFSKIGGMNDLFQNSYHNRTVLVTGHTGFKGSWLILWLQQLGANVVGYSLPDPPTTPSNFVIANLGQHITDVRGDIRDLAHLQQTIEEYQPRIVFHLAAQPIVLRSVQQPKLTFDTNTAGTVNVLEAIRTTSCVQALVSITTDKVYHNEEWLWGYRENDRLGGEDPYSASKAMAELAIAAYRTTYFAPARYEQHGVALASVRAGNVIGGGDFADYRLVPDCMKALMAGQAIQIRNPAYIRPWQHVLEPLSGYLWLGAKLLHEGPSYGEPWNFGPSELKGVTTRTLAEQLIALWGNGRWEHVNPHADKEETIRLRLSWDKSAARLNWQPVYSLAETLQEITNWFRAYQAEADMYQVGQAHIVDYVKSAQAQGLVWA